MSDALRLILLLALVAGNAYFVIAEYAVVTARRGPLNLRAEQGSLGAASALRLMDDPVRVISTVQVGITGIGILTGAVGEPAVRDILGGSVPGWVSFLIAFGSITFLTVVFGELVPKAVALEKAEAVAARIAPPIELMGRVLAPLVSVLQRSAKLVVRPFGITSVSAGDGISTPEELRAAVDEAEGSGVIPRSQEELLENVFDFSERDVADVMVPAAEVRWIDAADSVDAALEHVARAGHTRYPVARGSVDRIIGIVHARDLVGADRDGREADAVETLVRPVAMVPPTKPTIALLRELREARQQIAIVLDEYGGTLGIITLEDLVEQIVGEIEDENELSDNATLAWRDEREVVVAGATTIDAVNAAIGTALPRDHARTIAGLLVERLGRSPGAGDGVDVDTVTLRAERVEHARVVEVLVRLPPAPTASEPG